MIDNVSDICLFSGGSRGSGLRLWWQKSLRMGTSSISPWRAGFSCHKNVLAAQSSVLKRMFLSPIDMRKISYLQLQYKPGIVWKFVKFFYERKI